MNRHCCIAFLGLALFAGATRAADPAAPQAVEPDYRICLRNPAGQISLPDEPRRKNVFINLDAVGGPGDAQYFGGPSSDRFKVLKYDRINSSLICQEMATGRVFTLVSGKELNLANKPENPP